MNLIRILPIAFDVFINVVLCVVGAICTLSPSMVLGSWNQTLSARAGHMRAEGKPWGLFFAPIIDAIFGVGHCAAQWRREAMYGSVWAALGKT